MHLRGMAPTDGEDTASTGGPEDYRVLLSCPLVLDAIDDYADLLASYGIAYDVADVDQQLDEDELLDLLPDYDGILAGDDELTARVIEASPRLEVIAKWGIGTDGIDFDAAEAHGVRVFNTPGAFADEVADVVIGYAIMLARELHHVDREVRAGNWYCPRGVSLSGRTFGIVGVDHPLGRLVERAVEAHDVGPFEQLRPPSSRSGGRSCSNGPTS
ncbi:hypothetical protein BRC93_06835 [Halobacteriales archaeon QS_5_70_15]|nr:MAG: hypothetical protein BRC93_06835 [Halobacteriales archaeon QS_5_70_15]